MHDDPSASSRARAARPSILSAVVLLFAFGTMPETLVAQVPSFSAADTLSLVPRPRQTAPERRARSQPSLPAAWEDRQVPFVESTPAPVLTPAETSRGYLLFQRPITDIVYPGTRPLPHERVAVLSGFATPGEFEPLTFSIYPVRDLRNLRVQVTDLHFGEHTIPAAAVDVRLLMYWNVRYPGYRSDTYRRVPELLEKVTVHSSPSQECQRWWLTVQVPDGTPAGLYRGAVLIWDDDFAQAVRLPLRLQVLPFTLLQDPEKQYTAYNYSLYREVDDRTGARSQRAREYGDEWIFRAAGNEVRTMADFGFTTAPTLRLRYDTEADEYYIPHGERAIAEILAAGMGGPIPVVGSAIRQLYTHYTGETMGPHVRIPRMPPPELYTHLTRLVENLERQRRAAGWPEFIYVPIDEVAAESMDFGIEVYRAFKNAGVRTYATKNPVAVDAPGYGPYVDFWCSQPFAVSYAKAVSDESHGYWSYPNHNATEVRLPSVMNKGGRMTYGYGFWRSGYTLLIPWIWRWEKGQRFDYLDGTVSESGNQLDADGRIIPAVYWSSFREGVDDLRYLYTLQTAIVRRQGDAASREAVAEAEALLQFIWDHIQVQQKYEDQGLWPSEEFQALRWRVAQATLKLLETPATSDRASPSVLVEDTAGTQGDRSSLADLFQRELERGNLELTDLGDESFSPWLSGTGEGTREVTESVARAGKRSLLFRVLIDHEVDRGEGGAYPVGWPRLRAVFSRAIDFTRYDYITLWIMVDSDRDEVADDRTPFHLDVTTSRQKHTRYDLLEGADQRRWIPVVIPLDEMIDVSADPSEWTRVKSMQFWLSESQYRDGTRLDFYLDQIALARFKTPVIAGVEVSETVLVPAQVVTVRYRAYGANRSQPGEYQFQARLRHAAGAIVARATQDLLDGGRVVLPAGQVRAGEYTLRLQIADATGTVVSSQTRALVAVPGVIPTAVVEEGESQPLPETLQLQGNYPNPFNPSTRIRFALPRSGPTELAIYNVVGQRLRTLVDEPLAAGYHVVEWDGRDLTGLDAASGVYFTLLRHGTHRRAATMALVR